MALVIVFDLDTTQYDAINAFLNALLNEDVYVSLLDGLKAKGKI
jgi:small nuclear ribonucleoprotein (snRNP)-like protein